MIKPTKVSMATALVATAIIHLSFHANAQLSATNENDKNRYPVPYNRTIDQQGLGVIVNYNKVTPLAVDSSLLFDAPAKSDKIVLSNEISKATERKHLLGYLKAFALEPDAEYNESHKKFYYHLANVFAKLRLYPLAMKLFLKASVIKNQPGDAPDDQVSATGFPDSLARAPFIDDSGLLTVNSKDDSVVNNRALLFRQDNEKGTQSPQISGGKIINALSDGKKGVAYALLFHVKQPVPGKPKIFKFTNTGHTFITLIKYNSDSTCTSVSFGFYPKKDNILSATPLVPSTSSVFKDDSEHQWDEVVGKFISRRRFEKIVALIGQYDHLAYHLSKNNCTDFGLKAAAAAGIVIDKTTGYWPLGHGNNPAVTGQRILQGKVVDSESGTISSLFVDAKL